jgi:hypothetical protein
LSRGGYNRSIDPKTRNPSQVTFASAPLLSSRIKRKVDRIAVIAAHDWQRWLTSAIEVFLHPEVRLVTPNQLVLTSAEGASRRTLACALTSPRAGICFETPRFRAAP